MLQLNKSLMKKSFILISGIFLLSFLAYFNTVFHNMVLFNNFLFFIILFFITFFTIKDFKYGLYIALLELLLGSQGYLFDFKFSPDPDAFRISLRLGIFIILFVLFVVRLFKDRKIKFFKKENKILWQLSFIFAFMILLAVARAYLFSYSLSVIFSDVNNYFFWFYLVMAWQIDWNKKDGENLLSLAVSAFTFLNLLTFFLFYVFTHLMISWMVPIYKWIRDSRLGEITRMSMDHSVHRVFMQNHLYLIIVFIAGFLLIYFWPKKYKISWQKGYRFFSIFMISTVMSILLSQSRSFWVGGVVMFMFLSILLLKNIKWKKYWQAIKSSLIIVMCAFVGISALIFIEVDLGLGSQGNLGFLKDRANISDEAANSRWNQLPVLWSAIKKEPILGYGFGKALTYKTDDPRIINDIAPDGNYTTTAFEWGYLDMLVKFGVLGLIIYLSFIYYIWARVWSLDSNFKYWRLLLLLSIIFLLTIHIFTPYLNHPLGIGLLLVVVVLARNLYLISSNKKVKSF